MAVWMASHNGEGLYASRRFEPEIHRIKPLDYLVHHQNVLDPLRGETYWLSIDGTIAGMQLEDFTWIGKLGERGYGSVHLAMKK